MNDTEMTPERRQKLTAAVAAVERYKRHAKDNAVAIGIEAVVLLNEFERRGGDINEFPMMAIFRELKEKSAQLNREANEI
jgi:hypothetical protein